MEFAQPISPLSKTNQTKKKNKKNTEKQKAPIWASYMVTEVKYPQALYYMWGSVSTVV